MTELEAWMECSTFVLQHPGQELVRSVCVCVGGVDVCVCGWCGCVCVCMSKSHLVCSGHKTAAGVIHVAKMLVSSY